MPLSVLVILALIQGVTEFLPVSSSGHLILFPELTGTEDQGLAVDVAVHVGTLFAVMLYFWRDVLKVIEGSFDVLRGRVGTDAARLFLLLVLATIPVIVAGGVLHALDLTSAMRNITVIAWAMIIFGIALWWFDTRMETTRQAESWSLKDAIWMGLWQALALIPGTSRSGATITGARMLGFDRGDGAKLAMLMSIPTILASGVLLGLEVASGGVDRPVSDLLIAAALAFAAALLALFLMMRLLRSVSFTPYVIYRIALGLFLLWIASGRT